jgi:hypothetical protein
MPWIEAAPVVVSERERSQLETLVRQHRCPQQSETGAAGGLPIGASFRNPMRARNGLE